MLYFVIERFSEGTRDAVGERFRSQGRLLPAGVRYLDSWMTRDGRTCFQIMDAEARTLLDEWIAAWDDLVDFEVHEVERSAEYWARVH